MYQKVYLEIINTCNGSCSFCHGTKRAPSALSLSDFKIIVKKLVGITEYLYFHVMGEPLMHPQLVEMIKYATAEGFKCAITTNGILLPERSSELIASGIYKVSISLHSFEEGSAEFFASYLKGCTEFADKASSAGVLTVLRLWNSGYDGGRNKQIYAYLRDRLEGEWREGARGFRIRNKLHLEYGERFAWPDPEAPDVGNDVFCYALKDQFGILCDGTVVPCCLDADGNIPLGNAITEEITEILSSERAQSMRLGFMKRCAEEELCRRCGYARRFK